MDTPMQPHENVMHAPYADPSAPRANPTPAPTEAPPVAPAAAPAGSMAGRPAMGPTGQLAAASAGPPVADMSPQAFGGWTPPAYGGPAGWPGATRKPGRRMIAAGVGAVVIAVGGFFAIRAATAHASTPASAAGPGSTAAGQGPGGGPGGFGPGGAGGPPRGAPDSGRRSAEALPTSIHSNCRCCWDTRERLPRAGSGGRWVGG